ncbi:hypothetical protein OE88DRAFT_1739673 [Heliocybe sulcata]|uniref:Uncharacterized protein n=1 Tax=Heliocybe sulcata TaxID=5364 RepID=A0A5C3MPC5_9AGAM|nr:hypothetical protein OE88DRAFT_1739673 [Heliocybe sulcata]
MFPDSVKPDRRLLHFCPQLCVQPMHKPLPSLRSPPRKIPISLDVQTVPDPRCFLPLDLVIRSHSGAANHLQLSHPIVFTLIVLGSVTFALDIFPSQQLSSLSLARFGM